MTNNEKYTPVELLRVLLLLDEETGRMVWLPRNPHLFKASSPEKQEQLCASWNTRLAGTPALDCLDPSGHLSGRIFRRAIYAHRAVFAIVNGHWPEFTIDHINGNGADNRPTNLRDVPHIENHKNQASRKNNTSGAMGVSMNKRLGKWGAHITVAGKFHHLGFHQDIDAAIEARRAAEVQFKFHPNHGRAAS